MRSRNSAAAADWAAKRREQQEKAETLRAARASSRGDGGSVGGRAPVPSRGVLSESPQKDALDEFYTGAASHRSGSASSRGDHDTLDKPTSGIVKSRREADELDQLAKAFDRKTSFKGPASGRVPKPIPEAPVERITVHPSLGVPSGRQLGPPRHHAAQGHEYDDAYMDRFDRGYAALAGTRPTASAPRLRTGPPLSVVSDTSVSTFRVATLGRQWYKGPISPEGTLVELSDRPMLCMSVDTVSDEVAIGASDHAVYTLSLSTGRKLRTLYTARMGHTEWVTCIAHVPGPAGARVVSGGMDSKLCLWDSKGVRCKDLIGHSGSVSVVGCNASGSVVVSGSYDKSLRAWDTRTCTTVGTMSGHRGPVLCMAVGPNRIVSGGRDGKAVAWDLETCSAIGEMAGHSGHVTSVAWMTSDDMNVFLTGGQDGHVRVWDVRARREVANIAAHTTTAGSGAVGCIESSCTGSADVVVTAGADKKLAVLDPRAGFDVVTTFNEHKDFVYSLYIAGDVCFSGGGDGMLLAHSLTHNKPLWGVGANRAAVRCIGGSADKLVATGDDGCALIFGF